MKTLVMGWFSFPLYGATAGDLMAQDVVCAWLHDAGHEFDVALAAPFTGGVDWQTVDPSAYTHLLFVCGPFGENDVTREFLDRFGHCKKVGVNLSMLDSIDQWNPFDLLLERDSSRTCNPDISLLCDEVKPFFILEDFENFKNHRMIELFENLNFVLKTLDLIPADFIFLDHFDRP